MKKIVLSFIATLFLFWIYGCEGELCAEGTICDSETNQPVDSVRCEVLAGKIVQFSDETGNYFICIQIGGFAPDKIDIEVSFSKTGYKTKTVTNPETGSIIYLDRE